jgi:hypothetical protein
MLFNLYTLSIQILQLLLHFKMTSQSKFNSRGQMIEELDDFKPVSILGKRNFNDAFEYKTFDDSRFGQHISSDFFNKNIGHSVSQKLSSEKDIERKENVKIYSYQEEQDILQWCENYLASKNK